MKQSFDCYPKNGLWKAPVVVFHGIATLENKMAAPVMLLKFVGSAWIWRKMFLAVSLVKLFEHKHHLEIVLQVWNEPKQLLTIMGRGEGCHREPFPFSQSEPIIRSSDRIVE